MRAALCVALLLLAALVAACSDSASFSRDLGLAADARIEICDDSADNDNDGKVDCDDPDCAYAPQCSDGGPPPDHPAALPDKGLPKPDEGLPKPDQKVVPPDGPKPDQKVEPDKGVPDKGAPDQAVPDQAVPDTSSTTG